jgi:uncharacterized protein (TIGR00661 family)
MCFRVECVFTCGSLHAFVLAHLLGSIDAPTILLEKGPNLLMARILYGVMGDSRGHVSRSLAVAQLMPHHEYLFVGGGVVHELKTQGYQVEDAPMASTIRRNNSVDVWATLANAVKVFSHRGPAVDRIADIMRSFDPHLILTDYEFFTPLAARKLGRPCVSLDHQHVLTHCRYDPPQGQTLNRIMTCSTVKLLYSVATRYLIISFYAPPPVDPRTTEVFPPVVRAGILKRQPVQGDFGLVYLADRTFHGLLPLLEGRDRQFVVYGIGKQPPRGNLEFKDKSLEGFAEDMARCRYVISNAGHSLISEALYLGKPVLAFPRALEFEQFLNAHFLAKLGLGSYRTSLREAAAALDEFESNLGSYETTISKKRFFGNDRLKARVEELIGR